MCCLSNGNSSSVRWGNLKQAVQLFCGRGLRRKKAEGLVSYSEFLVYELIEADTWTDRKGRKLHWESVLAFSLIFIHFVRTLMQKYLFRHFFFFFLRVKT